MKHKSPKKRAKQDERRFLRNHSYKSRIATVTKQVLALVEKGDKEQALAEMKKAQALIDAAATKGILPKNTVGRRVGRIMRHVLAMS